MSIFYCNNLIEINFALPKTKLGSNKKIFKFKIFAATQSGTDMYPPVDINI